MLVTPEVPILNKMQPIDQPFPIPLPLLSPFSANYHSVDFYDIMSVFSVWFISLNIIIFSSIPITNHIFFYPNIS